MSIRVQFGRRTLPIGMPTIERAEAAVQRAEAAATTAAADAIAAAQPAIVQATQDAVAGAEAQIAADRQAAQEAATAATGAAQTAAADAAALAAPAAAAAIRDQVKTDADRAVAAASQTLSVPLVAQRSIAGLTVPTDPAWYSMDAFSHVYQDEAGLRPAMPGDAVARWDAVINGTRVPFTQPILGARPVLMAEDGRRFLRFGSTAVLVCMDAAARAAFAGNAGFFLSAAVRTESGPISDATTPDAVIFKVTQGTSSSNGALTARLALIARRRHDQVGFRFRRTDSSAVTRRMVDAPQNTDQVITATYNWTQPSSLAALFNGASYDTAPLDASVAGFGSTTPLHLTIGSALPHPGVGGEWTGRLYNLIFAPVAVPLTTATSVAKAQMSLMPQSPAAPAPVFDNFDDAYNGLGYYTGGGSFVGVRNDRSSGNDNTLRHFCVGVRGCLGKPLTLSILRQGQPLAGITDSSDRWRGSWAYDLTGPWHKFDRTEIVAGEIISTRLTRSERDTVYVAMRPVFNNDRWMQAISRWIKSPYVQRTTSGDALFRVGHLAGGVALDGRQFPGFDVHGFTIGTGSVRGVLTGNVHVDEFAGAYIYEGAVDWLLSSDPQAAAIRAGMTLYCYPGLNPQGRYLGYSRSEPLGNDANRIWSSDYDSIPLSQVMRSIWGADVTAPNFSLDFHDWSDRNTSGGIWRSSSENQAYVTELTNRYRSRTNRSLDVQNTGAEATIGNYWRSRGATFAATIEHGILFEDDWPNWQEFGRDVAKSLSAFLP